MTIIFLINDLIPFYIILQHLLLGSETLPLLSNYIILLLQIAHSL